MGFWAHRFATALAGLRPSTRFAVFAVPALIACAGCDTEVREPRVTLDTIHRWQGEDGLYLRTISDPQTTCQYLIVTQYASVSITPRIDDDGRPMCLNRSLREIDGEMMRRAR